MDPEVTQALQDFLIRVAHLGNDGWTDKQGEEIVRFFQDWRDLEPIDGIVGPITLAELGVGAEESTAVVRSVDWNDNSCHISKYFTVGEATKNGSRKPCNMEIEVNIIKLAEAMDPLREQWGSPWQVTSWYRPPAVNAAVGGATRSQHLTGSAADIYPTNGCIFEFQRWIDERWDCALGYGAAKGFVHLDLRPGRIRWTY